MTFNEQGHHFVQIDSTAYSLAPNNGYASRRSIAIYGPLGYSVDRVATMADALHDAETVARTMAAALSQCPPEAIATVRRYWYQDGRNASTPTENGVRFTPSCRISRRQYDALLASRNAVADDVTMAAIRQALASPHRATVEVLDEEMETAV